MPQFQSDQERFEWIRRHLYVPAVCDMLDSLGRREQAMQQRLRPLGPENCTIVGRARTIRWMEVDYVQREDPYGLEIEVMDSLGPGDVAVHSTDYAGTNAPWGELLSTVAKMRGAVGCICDGRRRPGRNRARNASSTERILKHCLMANPFEMVRRWPKRLFREALPAPIIAFAEELPAYLLVS